MVVVETNFSVQLESQAEQLPECLGNNNLVFLKNVKVSWAMFKHFQRDCWVNSNFRKSNIVGGGDIP